MIDFKKLALEYKDEALETLAKLISFPSVLDEYNPNSDAPFGDSNKDALNYILDKARHYGFLAKNVFNYAGHIEYGPSDGELIGVLAHLDVVPVTNQKWDTNPFKLTIDNNLMYGRGVLDDKGPLVASLFALKLLKDNHINLSKKVRLIMGCDEESGSRCLEHYFKNEDMPTIGFSPDAEFPVIYGEKAHANYYLYLNDEEKILKTFESGTRFNIVPSLAKMSLSVDLKDKYLAYLKENGYEGEIVGEDYIAYGKSSHAMCPQNGLNAAFILLKFLALNTNSKLAKYVNEYLLFDPYANKLNINVKDDDMGELTLNCGIFKLENNILTIGLDLRIPKDNYKNVINKALETSLKPYRYQYKNISYGDIHYVKKDSLLVTKLMDAYSSVTGDYHSQPFTIGGGTYAKFIKNCVAFGPQRPGSPDVCHIANEYYNVDNFVMDIAIYAKAIYELGK